MMSDPHDVLSAAGSGRREEATAPLTRGKMLISSAAGTTLRTPRKQSPSLVSGRSGKTDDKHRDKDNTVCSAAPVASCENFEDSQQQCLSLDRMVFSSMHFSSSAFVDTIANRVLFPVLSKIKRGAAAGGDGAAGESRAAETRQPPAASDGEDYAVVAKRLTGVLTSALAEVERAQAEEERALHANEVRCRRVETREKRRLATIRLGLEVTSARLHEYENRVCNALAATAGIEQHLSQSNARVLRGRSVSQLLQHFKMFTKMNHMELNAVLKTLSKARGEQRKHVTAQWEAGLVSPVDSMYFGEGDTGHQDDDGGSDNNDSNNSDNGSPMPRGSSRQKGPWKQQRRQHNAAQSHDVGAANATKASNSRGAGGGGGNHNNMHRLEAAAVASGLDRVFAVRSCTEAQVDWCQRLTCLRRELDGIVSGTKNIDLYVNWVRQELVDDVFHLVDCFNKLYKEHSDTAVHQAYGRTILKTLELLSRLYTTITPSHDALLSVFYSRAINQMGVELFSEHSPKPPPTEALLSDSAAFAASSSAMQHYHSVTEPELHRTFDFLISCARRDVIVVETIFGTTNSARQQLLAQMTEGVVKPFVTQHLKLVEFFERDMLESEARLSPRSRRRAATRVVDAITYAHTIQARLFSFFQMYVEELRGIFQKGEAEFLNKYVDSIFTGRAAFVERRAELELLRRYHTILEEQYTRDLHSVSDEVFDLRDAHMKKTKELIDRFTEVVARTCTYGPPKDVVPCILDLVKASLENMGRYMNEELQKTIDSVRADRENWRVKPKSEEELLHPSKPESQQCGLRMLLFVQSSLMNLNDAIATSCAPLLQNDTRLGSSIEEAKEAAFEALDEQAETLLNLCANAIIVRSLSILVHYQKRHDYMPKVTKEAEGEMLAQPCTRACTLFCLYITRQFEEAKEFIRLSNGQVQQRQTASRVATGATFECGMGTSLLTAPENAWHNSTSAGAPADVSDAVRARARTMNMQQLLYGDGGPSSFVRTVGVCLYRGIVTHLKTFLVTDRGALIYKQDVTAYMEAMGPIVRTPGLGGAVVEVLFRLLKETASLLLMSWNHIKGVRDTGLLRLLSNEEKLQFLKMREDLQNGLRKIAK